MLKILLLLLKAHAQILCSFSATLATASLNGQTTFQPLRLTKLDHNNIRPQQWKPLPFYKVSKVLNLFPQE